MGVAVVVVGVVAAVVVAVVAGSVVAAAAASDTIELEHVHQHTRMKVAVVSRC